MRTAHRSFDLQRWRAYSNQARQRSKKKATVRNVIAMLVRNGIAMLLVALSFCFMYDLLVDSSRHDAWFWLWLGPLVICAMVGYFAFVGGVFLKTFLHFVAVCLGLVLVQFVLDPVHPAPAEGAIEIQIQAAFSSLFLVVFISAAAF